MPNPFATIVQICASLPNHQTPGSPTITFTGNAGGGGFGASLICALNTGVHLTIYQSSWDNLAYINGWPVGPYAIHLTAGARHWFYQLIDGVWTYIYVPGEEQQDVTAARTFDIMTRQISEYLGI